MIARTLVIAATTALLFTAGSAQAARNFATVDQDTDDNFADVDQDGDNTADSINFVDGSQVTCCFNVGKNKANVTQINAKKNIIKWEQLGGENKFDSYQEGGSAVLYLDQGP